MVWAISAGGVEAGDAAEAGDQRGVEAAGADGGVGQVDDGVAGGVEFGEGGAERDGLAGADLTGDHAERGLGRCTSGSGRRLRRARRGGAASPGPGRGGTGCG